MIPGASPDDLTVAGQTCHRFETFTNEEVLCRAAFEADSRCVTQESRGATYGNSKITSHRDYHVGSHRDERSRRDSDEDG